MHDESTLDVLRRENPYPITQSISNTLLSKKPAEQPDILPRQLNSSEKTAAYPLYEAAFTEVGSSLTAEVIYVTGQGSDCNIFYRRRYLEDSLSSFFDIKVIVPFAYGYQTAWVLLKK